MFPEAFCHELLHQAEFWGPPGFSVSVYHWTSWNYRNLVCEGLWFYLLFMFFFWGNQSINEMLMKMSGKLLWRRSSRKFRLVLDFCYASDWFCLWVCLCTTFVYGGHLTPWNHNHVRTKQDSLCYYHLGSWGWRMEIMKQIHQHFTKAERLVFWRDPVERVKWQNVCKLHRW